MIARAEAVIVGAGAAGVMSAIWAGRTFPDRRIMVLDGAAKLGAKILVAGGGRCNVTHDQVEPDAYAGSSRNAIKKVLRRFDVAQTIGFFRELGVGLKREETGKLFPTSDKAVTILDALLRAVSDCPNVELHHPCRVESIEPIEDGFRISGAWGTIDAARVILATGGRSLPKSGSDGGGYRLVESLGHALTERLFPALVPLTLPADHYLCALSGLSAPATLTLHTATGKKLIACSGSTLCTHFGLSGPPVLDISRYFLNARFDDPGATITINWLPDSTAEQVEAELAAPNMSPAHYLDRRLPDRLARALCGAAGVSFGGALSRGKRGALARALTALPLPITGDRGYNYAEVTAGGVPLNAIRLETMESRVCAGLHLCGEICDVDGRIGGYNFQWAWASGYVAGVGLWRA